MEERTIDDRLRLVQELVPDVPSEGARLAINRLFATPEPDDDPNRHMADWNRGKRMQGTGAAVPYRHEDEWATGFYDRELRPVLMRAALIWLAERGELPGSGEGSGELDELVRTYFNG